MSDSKHWRILHTADTQLGYKQYGFETRLKDFNDVVDHIFTKALDLDIDVIDIAGDLFQTPTPPASCVSCLQRNVFSALNNNIAVVGIEGNHDPADQPNGWLLTCGITPLDFDKPTIKEFSDPVKGKLRIAGLNYYRPQELLKRIDALVETGPFDILVLHCSVAEMVGFPGIELTAAEIAHRVHKAGCKLVLMGDIHDGRQLEVGGVLFTYSGSPEMTALNENPHKTFDVITMTPDGPKIELHPIPTRPVVNLHIAEEKDVDNLLATLEKYKEVEPLMIITHAKSVPDFQRRARQMLDGRCMFRLIPMDDPEKVSIDIVAQLSQQSFERKGALNNLRKVVVEEFNYAEDSPQFQLIMELMETPDQVDERAIAFASSKGLKMVTQ